MLKRTTKPLRRTVLIEEGLAKSSKKQHSENTESGIFVKQVVFHTVNHRGPLPLKELHFTGETIAWRDPGGSWACLPPVYKCSHPAIVCDTCGLCPKQHTKKRGVLGNTKMNQSNRKGALATKTTLRRTESYKMLKRTKPLRKRVLIEEDLALKISTCRTKTSGIL